MATVTITLENVPLDVVNELRLAIAERIRAPILPGEPWTPPDPATQTQSNALVRAYFRQLILDYRAKVTAMQTEPDLGS